MAGRCDGIGEYNNVLSIIDFKNSRRIKTEEDIFDYSEENKEWVNHYKINNEQKSALGALLGFLELLDTNTISKGA